MLPLPQLLPRAECTKISPIYKIKPSGPNRRAFLRAAPAGNACTVRSLSIYHWVIARYRSFFRVGATLAVARQHHGTFCDVLGAFEKPLRGRATARVAPTRASLSARQIQFTSSSVWDFPWRRRRRRRRNSPAASAPGRSPPARSGSLPLSRPYPPFPYPQSRRKW